MADPDFRLLPESTAVDEIVDDPEFTDVTNDGETYTRYRVVRFTHESTASSGSWTHRANITRVRVPAIGVALLRVVDRIIDDSQVTMTALLDE